MGTVGPVPALSTTDPVIAAVAIVSWVRVPRGRTPFLGVVFVRIAGLGGNESGARARPCGGVRGVGKRPPRDFCKPTQLARIKRGDKLRLRSRGFSDCGAQWEYWSFEVGLEGRLLVEYGEDGGTSFDGALKDADIEEALYLVGLEPARGRLWARVAQPAIRMVPGNVQPRAQIAPPALRPRPEYRSHRCSRDTRLPIRS